MFCYRPLISRERPLAQQQPRSRKRQRPRRPGAGGGTDVPQGERRVDGPGGVQGSQERRVRGTRKQREHTGGMCARVCVVCLENGYLSPFE